MTFFSHSESFHIARLRGRREEISHVGGSRELPIGPIGLDQCEGFASGTRYAPECLLKVFVSGLGR